jgi:hypothetical protein
MITEDFPGAALRMWKVAILSAAKGKCELFRRMDGAKFE